MRAVAIPVSNTLLAELVEALGFQWAASFARNGWDYDLVLEGDAQAIILMLGGARSTTSNLAIIIIYTLSFISSISVFFVFVSSSRI